MAVVVVVLVILLALSVLPQMWVKRVIEAHAKERSDIPGTGGSFARYILDEMKLHQVRVEETELGDHYDPQDKAVRLNVANMRGRSLSAVVIAAHEVGHAMQDATGYGPLAARTKMARQAQRIQTIGYVVMIGAPVMMIVTKSPLLMVAQIIAGVMLLGSIVVMHALTLPVEFDASFRRALPVLEAGRFFNKADMKSARRILWAASLTYVAAALMSLLNIARWIRVLRF